MSDEAMLIKSIRTIADYPKPGILFRDITTLLGDARAFRRAIDELVQPGPGPRSTRSRESKLARLHPRRRDRASTLGRFRADPQKGRAADTKVSIAYSLEYGLDEMEMHEDAVTPASACCSSMTSSPRAAPLKGQ